MHNPLIDIDDLVLDREQWLATVNESGMTHKDHLDSVLKASHEDMEPIYEEYYGQYLSGIEAILGV